MPKTYSEAFVWRIRAQAALTEYYFEHGQFPDATDATALSINEDAAEVPGAVRYYWNLRSSPICT